MSTSPTARKLMPLNLVIDTRLLPERGQQKHGLLLRLTRDEFDALLDFTHAVKKRTGHKVTQQTIGRTAIQSFLSRHRAWTDCLPDQRATG